MQEPVSSVVDTRKAVNTVVAGRVVLALLLALLFQSTADSLLGSKIMLFITEKSPIAFLC